MTQLLSVSSGCSPEHRPFPGFTSTRDRVLRNYPSVLSIWLAKQQEHLPSTVASRKHRPPCLSQSNPRRNAWPRPNLRLKAIISLAPPALLPSEPSQSPIRPILLLCPVSRQFSVFPLPHRAPSPTDAISVETRPFAALSCQTARWSCICIINLSFGFSLANTRARFKLSSQPSCLGRTRAVISHKSPCLSTQI